MQKKRSKNQQEQQKYLYIHSYIRRYRECEIEKAHEQDFTLPLISIPNKIGNSLSLIFI